MRIVAALCLIILTSSGCARLLGRGSASTEGVVASPVDTTLKIAVAQLQAAGFSVQEMGEGSAYTLPRDIPAALADSSTRSVGDKWFITVRVGRESYAAGSRLTVDGFIVPRSAMNGPSGSTYPTVKITSKQRALYRSVQDITVRIARAANKAGPRQTGPRATGD